MILKNLMNFFRFDSARLDAAQLTAQGYLRADAYATRAGVFEYYLPDGNVYRELRPESEVFSQDSLQTLAGVALTDDHPMEPLSPENTHKYQVGHVSDSVSKEGDKVKVNLVITEDRCIKKVSERKKDQLSCGYFCDLDPTPGTWNGIEYDAVQKNIRYNHLSIVDVGRAGPDVKVKLDTQQDDQNIKFKNFLTQDAANGVLIEKKEQTLMKFKVDGVEYEGCEKVQGLVDSLKQENAKIKKDHDTVSGALEAEKAEKADLQAKLDSALDPKHLKQAAKELASVREVALSSGLKEDAIDDLDIDDLKKKVVVEHYMKGDSEKVEGFSVEKIDGMFEVLKATKPEKSQLDDVRVDSVQEKPSSADEIRQKKIQEQRNKAYGV